MVLTLRLFASDRFAVALEPLEDRACAARAVLAVDVEGRTFRLRHPPSRPRPPAWSRAADRRVTFVRGVGDRVLCNGARPRIDSGPGC